MSVYFKKREFMGHIFHDRKGANLVAPIFICLLFLVAFPATVLAHAKLMRSTPPTGKKVEPPEKVELWFNELLDGQFNSIEIFPATQTNSTHHLNLAIGKPEVDPKDKTHLTITVKPLEPGKYFVDWRVLSLDGHSAPGRFQFEVVPKAK